jgi:hypothetical protein
MPKMSGLLLCALCCIVLSACGGAKSGDSSHTNVVQVEAQFQSVVDAFTTESQAQGSPVTITDLIVQSTSNFPSGSEMGTCIQEEGATPVIQISQPLWDSLDADGQQELLFHELGHCVLGRVHEENLNNSVPTSLMNSEFLGSALYNANKAQYLHELFTGQNISSSLTMTIPQNALLPDFSADDSSQ